MNNEKLKELSKEFYDVAEAIKKLTEKKKALTEEIAELVDHKSCKTDFVSVVIVPDSGYMKVNAQRLKDDNLFEKYSDRSYRNGCVRITPKF